MAKISYTVQQKVNAVLNNPDLKPLYENLRYIGVNNSHEDIESYNPYLLATIRDKLQEKKEDPKCTLDAGQELYIYKLFDPYGIWIGVYLDVYLNPKNKN